MARQSRSARHRMDSSLSALARELPVRTLVPLALAIFALFALLGPVVDILSEGRLPPAIVAGNTFLSGLVAIGYAFGPMRRNWWLFGAAVAIHVIWFTTLGATGAGRPAEVPNPTQLKADGVAVIVLMVISYSAFLAFINITASRYLGVRTEIDLAHQIHQVLVPAIATRIGRYEFAGFSAASGQVGGDLVDVVSDQGRWFGYVADVSGHGVSSGVVMGMFKTALRMRLRHGGTLAELLVDVNEVLFPLKSGSMFVTVAGIRAGATDDTLEYTVAGHVPILRVRAGAVEEITTPQIPIGMFETYPFVSSTVDVRDGDVLAVITDGLIEVFDRNDREFGLDRVKSRLVETHGQPLAEIADGIVAAARAYGKQLDDQTLLLIRRT